MRTKRSGVRFGGGPQGRVWPARACPRTAPATTGETPDAAGVRRSCSAVWGTARTVTVRERRNASHARCRGSSDLFGVSDGGRVCGSGLGGFGVDRLDFRSSSSVDEGHVRARPTRTDSPRTAFIALWVVWLCERSVPVRWGFPRTETGRPSPCLSLPLSTKTPPLRAHAPR